MIEFDRAIGGQIGEKLFSDCDLVIHDYCRYVDDLRIVISSKNAKEDEIHKRLNDWVEKYLNEFGGQELSLNITETKVSALSNLDNSSSMANRLEMLQGELSGPADRNVLDGVGGMLEGLLSIENDDISELSENASRDGALIQTISFDHDIRPDTLKRFAANRLESIMRRKQRYTPFSNDPDSLAGVERKQ